MKMRIKDKNKNENRCEKQKENANQNKNQVIHACSPNTQMILWVHAPTNQENLGQFIKAVGACTHIHPRIVRPCTTMGAGNHSVLACFMSNNHECFWCKQNNYRDAMPLIQHCLKDYVLRADYFYIDAN